MRIVRISLATLDEFFEQTLAEIRTGEPQKEAKVFSYATPELLFQTFTTSRWHSIRVMTGAGPMSIRELARRLGRDIKGVHRDVKVLLEEDLVEHTSTGAIVFPYDAVHVDFLLKAEDLTFPVADHRAAAMSAERNSAQSPRTPRRPAVRRKSAARPAQNR